MKMVYSLLISVVIGAVPLVGMVKFDHELECPVCFTTINELQQKRVGICQLRCCSTETSQKFVCQPCSQHLYSQCPLCRQYNVFLQLLQYTIAQAPTAPVVIPALSDKAFKEERFSLLCKEISHYLKGRGSLAEFQITGLLNRYPYFNQNDIDRAIASVRPDIIAKRMFDQNRRIMAFGSIIIGATTIARWHITHSKYCRLEALASRIKNSRERLLNFDFDMFDISASKFLASDIEIFYFRWAVDDEQLRTDLDNAIRSYEVFLNRVWQKIIEGYYYKPNSEFLASEADLVSQLNESSNQLLSIIETCKKELVPSALAAIGVVSGISISVLLGSYAWYARYEKKWGIL